MVIQEYQGLLQYDRWRGQWWQHVITGGQTKCPLLWIPILALLLDSHDNLYELPFLICKIGIFFFLSLPASHGWDDYDTGNRGEKQI